MAEDRSPVSQMDHPAGVPLLVPKSDTVDMAWVSRCILVDQDTTAKLTFADGSTVEDYPLQKGYNPIRVQRVWSTGTDSVDVWALR